MESVKELNQKNIYNLPDDKLHNLHSRCHAYWSRENVDKELLRRIHVRVLNALIDRDLKHTRCNELDDYSLEQVTKDKEDIQFEGLTGVRLPYNQVHDIVEGTRKYIIVDCLRPSAYAGIPTYLMTKQFDVYGIIMIDNPKKQNGSYKYDVDVQEIFIDPVDVDTRPTEETWINNVVINKRINTELLEAADEVEDLVVIPDFISFTGSGATDEVDKEPHDNDFVIRGDFEAEDVKIPKRELFMKFRRAFPSKLQEDIRFIPSKIGPTWQAFSICDLVLRFHHPPKEVEVEESYSYHKKNVGDARGYSYDDLLEAIAEIEHKQWVAWSKDIAETEDINEARLERWKDLWVPYDELSEEDKDKDREWARKVINILHPGTKRKDKYWVIADVRGNINNIREELGIDADFQLHYTIGKFEEKLPQSVLDRLNNLIFKPDRIIHRDDYVLLIGSINKREVIDEIREEYDSEYNYAPHITISYNTSHSISTKDINLPEEIKLNNPKNISDVSAKNIYKRENKDVYVVGVPKEKEVLWRLQDELSITRNKYTDERGLHITLAYYKDFNPEQIYALNDKLVDIDRFYFKPTELDIFEESCLVLRGDVSNNIKNITNDIRDKFNADDTYEFNPHITLTYDWDKQDIPNIDLPDKITFNKPIVAIDYPLKKALATNNAWTPTVMLSPKDETFKDYLIEHGMLDEDTDNITATFEELFDLLHNINKKDFEIKLMQPFKPIKSREGYNVNSFEVGSEETLWKVWASGYMED